MSEIESESSATIQLVPTVIRREVSICAVCKDDISTNLGRRRILFHFGDQTRSDPTTEVVKQMHDLMSLFSNGVNGRQCDLTHCTQAFIESLSAKWCCRKCERMVGVVYKKFQELQQFFNQYKDCPLSALLNTLSVNNVNNDDINTNINNDSENTITIHGIIVEESQLNEECNEMVTNFTTESSETEAQKSPKKRKRTENDTQKEENQEKEEQQKTPSDDNQRKTRSKTSVVLNRSPPPEISLPKMNNKTKNTLIKEKKVNKKVAKEEKVDELVVEEVKPEVLPSERKLSETDNQMLSSLYNEYYEGILRAMLADNKLKSVAISEVGKFISRECLTASTEVAKMSHSIETMKMSEFKKLIHSSLSCTLNLLSAITGKDKLLNPPIVSIISILIYVLNSHANLFQKMMATLLLNAKCNPSTIEKLHTYKLCIAYETLVSFIDNNTDLKQIPKLIKSFQLT